MLHLIVYMFTCVLVVWNFIPNFNKFQADIQHLYSLLTRTMNASFLLYSSLNNNVNMLTTVLAQHNVIPNPKV